MEQYQQHGPGLFGDKTPLWFWVDHYQEAEARSSEVLRNFRRKVGREYFIQRMQSSNEPPDIEAVQRVLYFLELAT